MWNGLRGIDRAPSGVSARPVRYSINLSFARMILSDVLYCTVSPLRPELFLLKTPYGTQTSLGSLPALDHNNRLSDSYPALVPT